MKAAFRFNLCLSFAYRSLIVRSSFAHRSLIVRSVFGVDGFKKKWHKNCATISKMFSLTLQKTYTI